MRKVLVFIIMLYKRLFSPILTQLFGNTCRYTPTCSEYTMEALEKYGVGRGLMMGLKRFGKCHPWGGFGFDPVK